MYGWSYSGEYPFLQAEMNFGGGSSIVIQHFLNCWEFTLHFHTCIYRTQCSEFVSLFFDDNVIVTLLCISDILVLICKQKCNIKKFKLKNKNKKTNLQSHWREEQDPDTSVRIQIRTKMSQIHNTACNHENFKFWLRDKLVVQHCGHGSRTGNFLKFSLNIIDPWKPLSRSRSAKTSSTRPSRGSSSNAARVMRDLLWKGEIW
jgi:hypothetical protein